MTSACERASVHRGARRIEQEELLAERDEARVLHRAGREVGHGDDVELLVRVRDAEPVGERVDEPARRLERERAHAPLLPFVVMRRIGGFACARRLLDLELADRERDEVRRQRLRLARSGSVVFVARRPRAPISGVLRDGEHALRHA